MLKEQLDNGEITEAQYKTMASAQAQYNARIAAPISPVTPSMGNPYDESKFMSEDSIPDTGASLSEDDKLVLAMK